MDGSQRCIPLCPSLYVKGNTNSYTGDKFISVHNLPLVYIYIVMSVTIPKYAVLYLHRIYIMHAAGATKATKMDT